MLGETVLLQVLNVLKCGVPRWSVEGAVWAILKLLRVSYVRHKNLIDAEICYFPSFYPTGETSLKEARKQYARMVLGDLRPKLVVKPRIRKLDRTPGKKIMQNEIPAVAVMHAIAASGALLGWPRSHESAPHRFVSGFIAISLITGCSVKNGKFTNPLL